MLEVDFGSGSNPAATPAMEGKHWRNLKLTIGENKCDKYVSQTNMSRTLRR